MTTNGHPEIDALFLDIGGVLLTNGWDHHARRRAVDHFKLDYEELNERHHLTFDTYEVGKLSLDEYLDRVVFHERRSFTPDDFKAFMFKQSEALPDMMPLIGALRRRYGVKTVAVSNEGRELNEYRIRTFNLDCVIESFISSSYVHFRKPDADIFRLALDTAHTRPERVVYIDDRPMFVDIAVSLGIHGIRHTDTASTRAQLAEFGLTVTDDEIAAYANSNQ